MPDVHVVRLDAVGGVERLLCAYLVNGHGGDRVIVAGQGVHPVLALPAGAVLGGYRRWGKLPIPRALRAWRLSRMLRAARPDRVVCWNTALPGMLSAGPAPVVYYDHGASWTPSEELAVLIAGCAGVVACGTSSARMIALGFTAQPRALITVDNPGGRRPEVAVRSFPNGRPLVLGVAGRLVGVKGFVLAVRALAELPEATLVVAGAGPEAEALRRVASGLGVEPRLRMLGTVADMSAFYRQIDLLLMPSLRDPFPMVCLEAAAHGVPVVGAAVDGIPSIVGSGGHCIEPTLDLDGYRSLGGTTDTVPPRIYLAGSDALGEPRAVAPADLASAVRKLQDPTIYTAASAAALATAASRADAPGWAGQLHAAIQSIAPVSR
ncbi:hypothetical protein LBMAG53_18730 [Planctomycetota bacterium]|nr:hypothetical protein LBMAG53_18730 [Planctomycetota bacterium]